MADTTPPPPKSGGSGPFIIAAIVMVLLMGGLIYWKMSGSDQKKTDAPAVAATTAAPAFDEPPPPPPPPPVVEEPVKADPKKPKLLSGANPCAKECTGTATGALQSALSGRASQSRGCYEAALRNNATLEGTLVVGVKVGPGGQVCGARTVNDGLHDPGVTNCVINKFAGATLPSPQGGCVDINVPMKFMAKR